MPLPQPPACFPAFMEESLALLVESGAQGRRLRTKCFLLPPPETPHHSLFTRCVFQIHQVTGVQQMWPCLCTRCPLGLEHWLDTFPSAGLTGASFHPQPGLITRKLSLPPSSYPPPGWFLQPPGLGRPEAITLNILCACCSFLPKGFQI